MIMAKKPVRLTEKLIDTVRFHASYSGELFRKKYQFRTVSTAKSWNGGEYLSGVRVGRWRDRIVAGVGPGGAGG